MRVSERGLGIAKHPQTIGSHIRGYYLRIYPKSRRQAAMFGRFVKRDRPIQVRPAFCGVSRIEQGNSHLAMTNHEWDRLVLFLCQRQELRREIAHNVAVERHLARDPESPKDREQ